MHTLLCDTYQITGGKTLFTLQVFAGNFDRTSIVAHEMLPPFYANLVKIHPVSYHRWICMRVELFGCPAKVRKGLAQIRFSRN